MGERMSKQILGDNPFEDEGSGDRAADTPEGSGPETEETGPETEESASEAEDSRPGDAPAGAESAPAAQGTPSAGDTPSAEGAPSADNEGAAEAENAAATADSNAFATDANGESRAPDAAFPDPMPDEAGGDGDDAGDVVLGGEAAVPPGDYGPPIHSVLPDSRSVTSEVRELERRVRARLTPAFPIEEPRRLPLEFVWKRYRKLAMRGRSDIVDDYGRDPVYTSRAWPILDVLTRRYFRLETSGVDRIPETGRAILVANHAGPIPYDAAVLMHAVRQEHSVHRDLRPLVEDRAYHAPYLGKLLARIGAVRACQENAMRLLEDDELIAVFPEGSQGTGKLFKNRYRLQRFGRGGFIKLALRSRAPVVPVAIVGSEETQPVLHRITWLASTLGFPNIPVTPTFPLLGPLGLLPLPAKWRIHFGDPIDLAGEHDPEAAADRLLVSRLAEDVRSRIQSMVDEARGAPSGSG